MIFLKRRKFRISTSAFVLLLSLALNTGGLLSVSYTVADYFDVETSSDNLFEAGSIDFALDPSLLSKTSFSPGETLSEIVNIDNFSSLPFQYFVTSKNFGGDSEFCSALSINASFEGSELFSGNLNNLETPTTTLVVPWTFDIRFPNNAEFENKQCLFNLVYNGWQTTNIVNFGDGGFNDTEKVLGKIDSWGVRINKVYYDVLPEKGEEVLNEWVELYNQTDKDIDLSDWSICDNENCDSLIGLSPISANGFAIISGNDLTWKKWEVPDEFVKFVVDDESIGDGLDNDADMLQLRRGDGFVVDQMNWGEPDSEWSNYNSEIWSPGVEDVEEGLTIGRVPNGFDTDVSEDWYSLDFPKVNLIYPQQEGNGSWYWTWDYDITWEGVNPNGDDSNLSVDLYYIKDIDHDNVISSGDTIHVIAEDTENDGQYTWTVPSGFLGYIWVKIVVTGEENPMLTDSMTSGKIYDPFPIQLWEEDPFGVVDSLISPDDLNGEVLEIIDAVIEEEVLDEEKASDEIIAVEEEVVEEEVGEEEVASGGGGGVVAVEEEVVEEKVVEKELVIEEEGEEKPAPEDVVEKATVESIKKKQEELVVKVVVEQEEVDGEETVAEEIDAEEIFEEGLPVIDIDETVIEKKVIEDEDEEIVIEEIIEEKVIEEGLPVIDIEGVVVEELPIIEISEE